MIAWVISDIHLETIAKGAWDLLTPHISRIAPIFYGPWRRGDVWENHDFDPLFAFEI